MLFPLRASLRSFCLLPLVLGALAGCEGMQSRQQADEMQAPMTIRYVRLVSEAPPPLRAKTAPTLTSPRTQIWRPGYWSYGVTGYEWVPGEILDRPSPTAVWSPDHWVQHNYGWSFECGTWQ